jgi:hypothetical protein
MSEAPPASVQDRARPIKEEKMREERMQARSGAQAWVPGKVLGSAAIFIALSGTAVAAGGDPQSSTSGGPQASASVVTDKKFKTLKRQVRGLSRRLAALEAVPPVTTTSPGGPAGGALAGAYPNPTLNVSGGPCSNGQALTNLSALAALTCSPGVYSDASGNVAAGPTSFPALNAFALNNSALGDGALDSNAGGSSNTAVGEGALTANTTSNNTAVGQVALRDNTAGNGNSVLGQLAMSNNTTGGLNSALGQGALFANDAGGSNAAVGEDALEDNTTGNNNSAFGQGAMSNNTSGSDNTALGEAAGTNLTIGDSNIVIDNAGGVGGESDTTRIGTNGRQTRAFIAGIFGATVDGASDTPVLIDSNGQLGTLASSRRYKTDINTLEDVGVMKLRPVSFRYRSGPPELHYGLIAEEVEQVLPTLVAYGRNGLPETVQYQELPVLLLAELQRQQQRNRSLRAENRRQQVQIDWLIRQVGGG